MSRHRERESIAVLGIVGKCHTLTVAAVGAFHEDAFKVVIAGDTYGCRESGTGYSRLSRLIDNLHLRCGLEVDVKDVGVFFPDAGGIDRIDIRLVLGLLYEFVSLSCCHTTHKFCC